ncbi:MAG: radical SAM protein [Salinigranum sp.]
MTAPEVVLVADRSLMSNFRGNYILGFLSCAPTDWVPDVVYDRLFAPPIEAHPDGRATAAPMGLRRIEAALLEAGRSRADVAVAHPHHLDHVVGPETEVIGVNAMDPLGMGPVTSSFTHDSDRTPMNAVKFRSLMDRIDGLDFDGRLVVGGGGAWQVDNDEKRAEFGIDHVVHGEASHRAPELFEELAAGEADPTIVCESPDGWDDIPEIRGPTINSIVEAMRGCGRGCDFCGPDMRRNSYADVERLKREARVNAEAGYEYLWVHSEDILLYDYGKGFEPNREAIRTLYRELHDVDGIRKVGTTHMSLAAICRAPDLISDIADINDLGPNNWTGVQPGIETGSPRLIDMHLAGKPTPYDAEEWPDVVERAIRILNENYFYPACTLIIGLPGEQEEDVRHTIDMVESIDDTHSILAPLMYMDYAGGNTLSASDMSPAQWELFNKCWKHNAGEFKDKAWRATKGWNPAARVVSQGLAWLGAQGILRGLKRVEPTPA